MIQEDIANFRLYNQHLIGDKFQTPHEAVSYLGAVQAQDYFGASWSLGQRIQNATSETIEKALNDGTIIRTHIMRPTWHFVSPEDIRWIQKLTASQVKKLLGHYNRKLELDDALFSKSTALIVKLLQEKKHATRQELKTELTKNGIKTDVQRLAHIVMWAELDGIICSGPRTGKQFTYALLDDRVKKHTTFNREAALAELTKRYFTSHGPAQIKDFAWWSGLSIKDAQEGLDMNKSKLSEETIDGKTYWFTKKEKITPQKTQAFLLSIYDEFTIAYKDRSALGSEKYIEKFISMGNALTAVIILDGKVIGTWKRISKKNSVEILLNPFEKLNHNQHEALQKEIEKYNTFLGISVS